MKTFVFVGVLLFVCAPAAHAQPSVQSTPAPPASFSRLRWSAGMGYETFALRDIARTARPVTASPIAWEGSGPVFRGRVAWENERRLHQIDLGASVSGGFEYRGPVRDVATAESDRARSFDARYEYRRYLFRDLVFRGLDLGGGVEALAARTSISRRVPPDVEMDEARTNAGIGGSVAARLRRWDRVGGEIVWTNGLVIGARREEWTNGTAASGGGGGWLSTLAVHADVRVARSARLFANYTGSGEGFLASHRSVAVSRRRLAMGVSYER